MRSGCALVASDASHVRIVAERLDAYAEALPLERGTDPVTVLPEADGDAETLAAYVLSLDAINYGSGFFPSLRKRPGLSGYRTIEAALCERFESQGPLSAAELSATTATSVARLLGQHPAGKPIGELMRLYAESWRDLGNLVTHESGGVFGELVASARGSAEAMVRTLLRMPLYRDVARYDALVIPFLKRAQLTVADLAAALPDGLGDFRDLDRLTLFADNLVPHVLRVDGLLEYQDVLLARIERAEQIPAGSREEIEIRACAVHTVELLVARVHDCGGTLTAADLDYLLWARGAAPRYKSRPRHRTRTTYY